MMTPAEIRAKATESGLISVVPDDVWERLQADARSFVAIWGNPENAAAAQVAVLSIAGDAWLDGYLIALEQSQRRPS